MCHIRLSSFCVRRVFHLYILHLQWVFNHFQSIIFNSLHYIDGKLITTITSQNPILSNYNLIHLSELLSLSELLCFLQNPVIAFHVSVMVARRYEDSAVGWGWGLAGSQGDTPRGGQPAWVQIWVQQSSGCCNHGEVTQSLRASIASFVKWG